MFLFVLHEKQNVKENLEAKKASEPIAVRNTFFHQLATQVLNDALVTCLNRQGIDRDLIFTASRLENFAKEKPSSTAWQPTTTTKKMMNDTASTWPRGASPLRIQGQGLLGKPPTRNIKSDASSFNPQVKRDRSVRALFLLIT